MTFFYYSDHYEVDLPIKHRFPLSKYRLLREKLVGQSIITTDQLIPASIASRDLALIAHDYSYVEDVFNLTLEHKKARRIGLPLTQDMVNRTLVSLDASYQAAKTALKYGVSAALSSGTHHAGYAHGEGYCFFNDFAVICKDHRNLKILIIDLDVHQGNGNGQLLKDDKNVTIIDFYCEQNYPFRKDLTGLTKSFNKNTQDDEYLSQLDHTLELIDRDFDLILYQAGVDIYEEDHLGLLSISKDGIKKRDEFVFNFAQKNNIPISFVIGGGYCEQIEKTVECNFNTFDTAKNIFKF